MKGCTSGTVVRKCSESWGVTGRQVEKYLAKAREKIVEIINTELPSALEQGIAVYDRIIEMAIVEGSTKYTKDGDMYVDYDLHAAKAANTDKLKALGIMKNNLNISGGISKEDREAFGNLPTEELEKYA